MRSRSFAEWQNIELIVMGTRGRRGFERLVLGSTTDRLMRRSGCPVLVVSNPSHIAMWPGTHRLVERRSDDCFAIGTAQQVDSGKQTTARGGDALDSAVFGSATYRVIHLGPCPVLEIHTWEARNCIL
jgi:nucleotide-binding universal stress UspA family protein